LAQSLKHDQICIRYHFFNTSKPTWHEPSDSYPALVHDIWPATATSTAIAHMPYHIPVPNRVSVITLLVQPWS
jgi:hypothetical protein